MNQCKAVTSISSSILMYLTLRRATCHVSTVAEGQCRRTLHSNVVSSCDGQWSMSCGTHVAML